MKVLQKLSEHDFLKVRNALRYLPNLSMIQIGIPYVTHLFNADPPILMLIIPDY